MMQKTGFDFDIVSCYFVRYIQRCFGKVGLHEGYAPSLLTLFLLLFTKLPAGVPRSQVAVGLFADLLRREEREDRLAASLSPHYRCHRGDLMAR